MGPPQGGDPRMGGETLEFTKYLKNPKFHFGFLGKVQIWTKNSTYYPFSPPAEFTKISQKSKVPLWIFRKGPKMDKKNQRITPSRHRLNLQKMSKIQSSTLDF